MSDKKLYVVGFMFSDDKEIVVLIRKNRPEWQAGKLNGVGGKIEFGEPPIAAMVREFREETGVSTKWNDWEQFAILEGEYAKIYVFRGKSDEYTQKVTTTTDEKIGAYYIEAAVLEKSIIVPNLVWLIPMARYGEMFQAEVKFDAKF